MCQEKATMPQKNFLQVYPKSTDTNVQRLCKIGRPRHPNCKSQLLRLSFYLWKSATWFFLTSSPNKPNTFVYCDEETGLGQFCSRGLTRSFTFRKEPYCVVLR
jgi:hypothetical protein